MCNTGCSLTTQIVYENMGINYKKYRVFQGRLNTIAQVILK